MLLTALVLNGDLLVAISWPDGEERWGVVGSLWSRPLFANSAVPWDTMTLPAGRWWCQYTILTTLPANSRSYFKIGLWFAYSQIPSLWFGGGIFNGFVQLKKKWLFSTLGALIGLYNTVLCSGWRFYGNKGLVGVEWFGEGWFHAMIFLFFTEDVEKIIFLFGAGQETSLPLSRRISLQYLSTSFFLSFIKF